MSDPNTLPADLPERFLANVSPEPNSGCWLWTGAYFTTGYGCISVHNKNARAHRVALLVAGIELPRGACVCHRCDNRGCVNPAHLFVGTQGDNSRDRNQKGRTFHGPGHHSARLTPADVREIRRRLSAGETQTALGREYGIGQSSVSCIVRRRSWGWLP